MSSMPACWTLKNCRLVRKSCSFSERAPAMKLTCSASHPPWWRNVLLRSDLMIAYWSSATRLWHTLSDLLPCLVQKKDTPFAWVCLQGFRGLDCSCLIMKESLTIHILLHYYIQDVDSQRTFLCKHAGRTVDFHFFSPHLSQNQFPSIPNLSKEKFLVS